MIDADIRPMRHAEAEGVLEVWHATKRASWHWHPVESRRPLEQDRGFFEKVLLKRCDIWVAAEGDQILGMLAMEGRSIDQLFVSNAHQRQGIGKALLDRAKQLSPTGLRLFTLQQNVDAVRFYVRHGFRVGHYGRSPAPEDPGT